MTLPSETFNWLRLQCGPDANHAIQRLHGENAICCLICGMASFNKNDIEQRYCGSCHQFFALLPSWSEAEKEVADHEASPTWSEAAVL